MQTAKAKGEISHQILVCGCAFISLVFCCCFRNVVRNRRRNSLRRRRRRGTEEGQKKNPSSNTERERERTMFLSFAAREGRKRAAAGGAFFSSFSSSGNTNKSGLMTMMMMPTMMKDVGVRGSSAIKKCATTTIPRRLISSSSTSSSSSLAASVKVVQKELLLAKRGMIRKEARRRTFASDATSSAAVAAGQQTQQQSSTKGEFRLLPKICSIADMKLNEMQFFQKTIPFLRCTSSSSRNGMTLTELCGHSAFVLLGWSYVVDDPFLLRCLATASFTAQICFQFFREKPLWLPIRWNVLFVGVNMIWIAKMLNEYSEKSLKDLTSEEREVYDAFFKVKEKEVVTMSSSEIEETNSRGEKVVSAAPKKTTKTYRTHQIHPSDFKELVKLGEWKELKEGEVIAVKGKVNTNIYAIVDGAVALTLDDSVVPVAASAREKTAATTKKSASLPANNNIRKNILRRGKFVGEMALSHGAAFGTVVVEKEGAKVMVWDTHKLREFVMENPRAMNSVQASFGRSLVEKVKIVGME